MSLASRENEWKRARCSFVRGLALVKRGGSKNPSVGVWWEAATSSLAWLDYPDVFGVWLVSESALNCLCRHITETASSLWYLYFGHGRYCDSLKTDIFALVVSTHLSSTGQRMMHNHSPNMPHTLGLSPKTHNWQHLSWESACTDDRPSLGSHSPTIDEGLTCSL
jgi:hypothetical protein